MSNLPLELSKTLQEQAEKKLLEYAESLVGKKINGFTIRKFYRSTKKGKVLRLKADKRIDGTLHQVSFATNLAKEEIAKKIEEYVKENNLKNS